MGDDVVVMWFRRDLRVGDNPALVAAAEAGRVVPLFVHDDALVGPAGANRVAYLHATLDVLGSDLDGALVERTGSPIDVVPSVASEVGATTVFAAADFGPYGQGRDEAVHRALAAGGRNLRFVGSPYAVAPGTLHTQAGGPFKVFTPYSKAWRAHGVAEPGATPQEVVWSGSVRAARRPPTPRP